MNVTFDTYQEALDFLSTKLEPSVGCEVSILTTLAGKFLISWRI